MTTLLTWSSALILAFALAGCASTSTTAARCSSCKWGPKSTAGPMQDPVAYCIVDDKKSPLEYRECAKAQQAK